MPLSKIVAKSITDDTITTDQIADTSVHGRRNLIINGGMEIAQRGTEVTGLSSSNTYQTVDRMFIRNSGAGTFTSKQSTENPGYGFRRSIEFDCTTADSSLAAADFAYMGYKMEGFDAVRTRKGMDGAGDVTLSFWVQSSETGTAVVGFNDSDNSRLQNRQYTINAANTWERKTITISFIDGTNTFNYDNGQSLMLFFWIAAGTDRTSGSLQTSWASSVTANEAAGQTVNAMSSTDSYIRFTGIQLEVGDKATPFEHRSFGEELALCQRYFAYAQAGISGGAVSGTHLCLTYYPRVEFRALPSLSLTNNLKVDLPGVHNKTQSSTSISHSFSDVDGAINMYCGNFSGLTRSDFYVMRTNGDIHFDAEL